MSSWVTHADGDALILARPGRARFDFSTQTTLPGQPMSRRRLAHQVRQDLWRALRAVPGFSPVVRVAPSSDGFEITAGGQLDRVPVTARLLELTEAVLTDPDNRRRWIAHARVRR